MQINALCTFGTVALLMDLCVGLYQFDCAILLLTCWSRYWFACVRDNLIGRLVARDSDRAGIHTKLVSSLSSLTVSMERNDWNGLGRKCMSRFHFAHRVTWLREFYNCHLEPEMWIAPLAVLCKGNFTRTGRCWYMKLQNTISDTQDKVKTPPDP